MLTVTNVSAVGHNEFHELRHGPIFNGMPLPELAALGPAYLTLIRRRLEATTTNAT